MEFAFNYASIERKFSLLSYKQNEVQMLGPEVTCNKV